MDTQANYQVIDEQVITHPPTFDKRGRPRAEVAIQGALKIAGKTYEWNRVVSVRLVEVINESPL